MYVILIFFYPVTYPLSALYGLLWCGFFHYLYTRTDADGRRRLRLLAPLVVFAFVVPAHMILTVLGVPSLWPRELAPP
jgi:hypothetical protein